MKDEEEKYELVIESSINILKVYCTITFIVFGFILLINNVYELSYIWNICYLIPLFLIVFASFIQLILCFWRVGKVDCNTIEKANSKKSNLIFSASITYFAFLGASFLYILLSIILFS